jgi:protein-S-isoprenylcysteine O-methyltransferase
MAKRGQSSNDFGQSPVLFCAACGKVNVDVSPKYFFGVSTLAGIEGSRETMFDIRNVAITIFFLWLMIDGVVVARHRTGKVENRDRFSLMVIVAGNLVAWFVAVSLAFSPIGTVHSIALQIAGVVIMGTGIVVRSIAIAQLGRFHTPNVAVRQEHQLMESGLYRHVRHPSYLGALIAFFGFSAALGNWLSIVVVMVITPSIYLFRIREEEAALGAAFGDAYIKYCGRTKRLIPGLY